jgi:hypothetical protein
MFYDSSISYIFLIGVNSIHTILYQKFNNFVITSTLSIYKMEDIIDARYYQKDKSITLMTNNYLWMVIDAENYKVLEYFQYLFPVNKI